MVSVHLINLLWANFSFVVAAPSEYNCAQFLAHVLRALLKISELILSIMYSENEKCLVAVKFGELDESSIVHQT